MGMNGGVGWGMGGDEGDWEHNGGGGDTGHGSPELKTRKNQAQAFTLPRLEAITEARFAGSKI